MLHNRPLMDPTHVSPVPPLGAFVDSDGLCFRTWSPDHERVELVLYAPPGGRTPRERIAMDREPGGYFVARLPPPTGPCWYRLSVDGSDPFPDPWSQSQPLGVHGPSEVVSFAFHWTDGAWKGIPRNDLVIYEVHVGTATQDGTFDALIERLPYLAALGVTALELMPVASFAGRWNWGYDGVSLFAPAAVYGGPSGLHRLVDRAHAVGLAVILDVVYNHLGPDGNYLGQLSAHYHSTRHHSLWGAALNLDSDDSAPVRELCLRNVEMWLRDYHLDGLRLDATDAIFDDHDPHIVAEIVQRAHAAVKGRIVHIIAEDDRNDASLVKPVSEGGVGLDAVWAGDLHHAVRCAFTFDHEGYFADYKGTAEEIATALDGGWIFEGRPALRYGGKSRGTPAHAVDPTRIVQFIQNHDQVGNRAEGDRLGLGAGAAAFRALSALLLLSPYTPLLFMGQEWNASTPFQFFTDHHEELGRKVTEGRRSEFKAFASFKGEIPDPQDEATFRRSKIRWDEREDPAHREVLALYRELLALRTTNPCLRCRDRSSFKARAIGPSTVVLDRRCDDGLMRIVMNRTGTLDVPVDPGLSVKLVTEEERFGGSLHRKESVVVGGRLHVQGPVTVVLAR